MFASRTAENRALSAVFLQFEVMDSGTLEGTGKPHTVAMTTADAMWLLKHLEYLQKRFDLRIPAGDPDCRFDT